MAEYDKETKDFRTAMEMAAKFLGDSKKKGLAPESTLGGALVIFAQAAYYSAPTKKEADRLIKFAIDCGWEAHKDDNDNIVAFPNILGGKK